ncbi:MAG: BamA/TamA family outer membrane protein [Bacteroidales bacterium]
MKNPSSKLKRLNRPLKRFTGPFCYLTPRVVVILLVAASSWGCSNLKYLEQDQTLYTGSNIQIESENRIREKGRIESELQSVITPEPNKRILGLRPWLWIYNVAGEPTGKGLRYLMRERLGEPPVLFEQVSPQRTTRLMENRLMNLGYFDRDVSFQVNQEDQKASVDYFVELRTAYRFRKVYPLVADTGVAALINEALQESLIREDRPYRLEVMQNERERIDGLLKSKGYFYFFPDALLFRADSIVGTRQVDLFPVLKPEVPAETTRQYRIGNVSIYADYLMDDSNMGSRTDTIMLDQGVYLFDSRNQYKQFVIDGAVFLRPGDLYDIKEHNRTLNHLSSLGVFRFVNLRFIPNTRDGAHYLDVRIMLSPMDKKSISAEVRGITKSNDFAGPGIMTSFTNRNFLGGAEDFRFSLNAAYETLIGREVSANVWEAGGEVELSFPRFVLPFGNPSSRVFSPKTNFSLGLDYLNRSDAFELTSVNFKYGYSWNRFTILYHRLVPLAVNVFSLGRVHENASGQLVDNVLLRQSLFEQFILGSEYSFFYNTQLQGISNNDYFFNLNFDTSGNTAWLLTNLAGGDPDQGLEIFNQSFAQYFKADFDARYYRRLTGDTRLATRLIAGVGVPYGNSTNLPYLKQFIIGGSTSVRAFHPRSLGPGTYMSPDSLQGLFNIHQVGELKLEVNVEYRIDITSIFKGAVFVDAGNVWRLDEDENTPGGEFNFDTFLEQIAMGAGLGLRLDVNFFVLRFDFAFPLAVPYSDHPGYFDPVKPFNGRWLLDNMVFNLGIGYPF